MGIFQALTCLLLCASISHGLAFESIPKEALGSQPRRARAANRNIHQRDLSVYIGITPGAIGPGAAGPTTTPPSTTSISMTSTEPLPFSCATNGPDPDDGLLSFTCVCSQGTTTSEVFGSMNSCPWTGFPLAGATPITATISPAQTNTNLFTSTSGDFVLLCPSSTVMTTDNVILTECAGPSTITASVLPHATVQYGSSTQSVGTLSGSALVTAISNALVSACPPPATDGQAAACTATPTLSNIPYTYSYVTERFGGRGGGPTQVTPTAWAGDGTLVIDPGDNQYTSGDILDALIKLSANTFASSANCQETPPDLFSRSLDGNNTLDSRDLEPRQINGLLCGVVKYGQVVYENSQINPLGSAAWLNTALTFNIGAAQQQQIDEGIDEACDTIGLLIEAMFEVVFPELEALELGAADAISGVCAAIGEEVGGRGS